MPDLLSQLLSCLLEALVLYPLVYCGRVLDRFKLCCFLRRDGWIPGRGYILRCLLSAVLLVYCCELVRTRKMVTSWMSGYAYNLTTSHDLFLGDRNRTRAVFYQELKNASLSFPVQYFLRSNGEDVSLDCIYLFPGDRRPNLQWYYMFLDGNSSLVNTSLRHNIEQKISETELISQLAIVNITEEDYGYYGCTLAKKIVSYFVLLKVDPTFTRVSAPPGSVLAVSMLYQSVDSPYYDSPSSHYRINGNIDPVRLKDNTSGCSPALRTLEYTRYAEQANFKTHTAIAVNTHLFRTTYDEEPGELDRPLYTELYLRFCLSPERFGLYTFYTTRTFYNTSSKTSETVTAEHPWTILVEPRLPDGINWFIPGYDFIPVYRTELNNSYKEMYQTILSGEHMFEKGASVVLWVQWCVFLVLMPSLCLMGLYIYSKYAPGVMLFLWLCLVKTVSLILPVCTHVSETETAGALPGYDLMILSSENSKYWVNEYIITPVREWYLLAFWEELLSPDSFYLSSSLDALVKTRKVIVIVSPDSPDDRLLCFKFECLLHRVVEGFLSPVDVMLVRWGNVDVDKFRYHHQFEVFDWDNTVFPRDAFRRKLSKWLGV